ncbi:MAG: hypothetical protein ACREVH_11420 [Gammaproteobacteria bacterium]
MIPSTSHASRGQLSAYQESVDLRTVIERAAEASTPSKPLRVLVVDDNDDVRQSTETLLSLNGHEVWN